MPAYDDALQELARAPLAEFVAERQRLAAELRAAGEKDAAARLGKRRRPTTSVWVVNQLYWQRRAAFDRMVEAAGRLREGDLAATRAYRTALAGLRRDAASLLEEAGLGASDATLRRASATLAALAAAGGFAPDPPGALGEDREPPGFEALTQAEARPAAARDERAAPARASREEERDRERQRRGLEDRQRERQSELERARRKRERERLERELRSATAERDRRRRETARLEEQVTDARRRLDDVEGRVAALERERGRLDEA